MFYKTNVMHMYVRRETNKVDRDRRTYPADMW
jgi:hypothetical protein